MSMLFSGFWAMAFAVLGGILLAMGTGLLGRWLLGIPAAVLAAPLRRLGAAGLLAATGLAANRWRTAALATPILLVAMLAGIQGTVESSNQRHTEDVTRLRVHAPHVVVGAEGAPLPAGTAAAVARLGGVDAVTAVVPTELYPLAGGLADQSPWTAAGLSGASTATTIDPDVVRGSLDDVRGDAVAVSRVFADGGDLRVGDTVPSGWPTRRPPRCASPRSTTAQRDSATSCSTPPSPDATRQLPATRRCSSPVARPPRRRSSRYASDHPGVQSLNRTQYLDTVHASNVDGAWGVWLIVGLAAAFATLALINTAAMTTTERRDELATIRLLGGTAGHAIRMVTLEMLPTVITALGAGAAIVAIAVAGVPRGLTGFPLVVPLELTGGLASRRSHPWPARRSRDHATSAPGIARRGDARQGVKAPPQTRPEAAPTGPPLPLPEPDHSRATTGLTTGGLHERSFDSRPPNGCFAVPDAVTSGSDCQPLRSEFGDLATDLDSAIHGADMNFATTVRRLVADQPPAVPEAQKLDMGGAGGGVFRDTSSAVKRTATRCQPRQRRRRHAQSRRARASRAVRQREPRLGSADRRRVSSSTMWSSPRATRTTEAAPPPAHREVQPAPARWGRSAPSASRRRAAVTGPARVMNTHGPVSPCSASTPAAARVPCPHSSSSALGENQRISSSPVLRVITNAVAAWPALRATACIHAASAEPGRMTTPAGLPFSVPLLNDDMWCSHSAS